MHCSPPPFHATHLKVATNNIIDASEILTPIVVPGIYRLRRHCSRRRFEGRTGRSTSRRGRETLGSSRGERGLALSPIIIFTGESVGQQHCFGRAQVTAMSWISCASYICI